MGSFKASIVHAENADDGGTSGLSSPDGSQRGILALAHRSQDFTYWATILARPQKLGIDFLAKKRVLQIPRCPARGESWAL